MHYFHNLLSASGGFVQRPSPRLHPWTLLEHFGPHTLNLPTPGKILRAPICASNKDTRRYLLHAPLIVCFYTKHLLDM